MVRNTDLVWGWTAKGLHWIAALFVLLLLAHGWWMTHMAPRPERLAHYAGHSAMGFDLLMVLRLLWRWLNPVPAPPADSKTWERWSAHAVHFGMYVLMWCRSPAGSWRTRSVRRSPATSSASRFR